MLNVAEEDKYPKFCQKLRIVLLVIELSSAALAEAVIKPALKKYAAQALEEYGKLNRYLQETEEMARAKQQLEAFVTPERYPLGIPEKIGDDLYVLQKNGDEIFRGTKKEVDEFAERLKKSIDDNPYKNVDELIYATKMKIADKMWKEYKYLNFLDKPPKKPCFLAGTLIHTKTGLVPIEKIAIGMEVLSFNFETQKTEYQPVLQTFSNNAEKYIEVKTEKALLKVTGAHLFYVPNDKKWIPASQLKLDTQLIDAEQNLITIKSIEIIKNNVPTYNLEVAQNHNYYVGESQAILTHNDSKKLKFTSEILYEFNFYEYYDIKGKPTYVGQTTQGLTKRADQHLQEYKKNALKKKFIEVSRPLPRDIMINGKMGPFKMTPFEAAITEMYELQVRGGKRNGAMGLYNKKNPVS